MSKPDICTKYQSSDLANYDFGCDGWDAATVLKQEIEGIAEASLPMFKRVVVEQDGDLYLSGLYHAITVRPNGSYEIYPFEFVHSEECGHSDSHGCYECEVQTGVFNRAKYERMKAALLIASNQCRGD